MKIIEGNIIQAIEVHASIPEFTKPSEVSYFEDRYLDKKHTIFIA